MLLAVALGGGLATGQSPRRQAQGRFATQLAATPSHAAAVALSREPTG
jgi:hypothetical protein